MTVTFHQKQASSLQYTAFGSIQSCSDQNSSKPATEPMVVVLANAARVKLPCDLDFTNVSDNQPIFQLKAL
jgi:hypothetical protein